VQEPIGKQSPESVIVPWAADARKSPTDYSTLYPAGDAAEDAVQVNDPQGVKRLLDKVENNLSWLCSQ